MQRTVIGIIASIVLLSQAITLTQSKPPLLATDITAAEVQAVLAAPAASADRLIIPPGVYHGFDDVTTGIDYLAVRPDPNHVLPAGYVHPAIRK